MEALWRAGLRVTQFLSSGLRGDSRPHAQFPFLQSKEGSVCRARSLGHKNRIFERLDFPFLTVDLLRKRHFNKIFFFLCFSKNHIQWGEQSCGEDFSALCFFFPRQAQVRQTFPLNCPLCWHLVPLPPPASRLFAWPPTKSHKHPLSSIVGLITETSHTVI